MSTPLFHDLRVRRIEPDTPEASIVSFDVPPALREVFGFTACKALWRCVACKEPFEYFKPL